MQIPSIVKFTAINFVKAMLFVTVGAIVISILLALIWLSEHYLGHPAWAVVPMFIGFMLFMSYLQARTDVVREERRNQTIAERLSRED